MYASSARRPTHFTACFLEDVEDKFLQSKALSCLAVPSGRVRGSLWHIRIHVYHASYLAEVVEIVECLALFQSKSLKEHVIFSVLSKVR